MNHPSPRARTLLFGLIIAVIIGLCNLLCTDQHDILEQKPNAEVKGNEEFELYMKANGAFNEALEAKDHKKMDSALKEASKHSKLYHEYVLKHHSR